MTRPAGELSAAATTAPCYGTITAHRWRVLAVATGWMLDAMGSLVAELFPTAVRVRAREGATTHGAWSAGAVAPFTTGAAPTLPGIGIGSFTLPDMSGQALE